MGFRCEDIWRRGLKGSSFIYYNCEFSYFYAVMYFPWQNHENLYFLSGGTCDVLKTLFESQIKEKWHSIFPIQLSMNLHLNVSLLGWSKYGLILTLWFSIPKNHMIHIQSRNNMIGSLLSIFLSAVCVFLPLFLLKPPTYSCQNYCDFLKFSLKKLTSSPNHPKYVTKMWLKK